MPKQQVAYSENGDLSRRGRWYERELKVKGWESEDRTDQRLLDHLARKTGSESSRRSYLDTLARLCRREGKTPSELVRLRKSEAEDAVQSYLDTMLKAGVSKAWIKSSMAHLVAFFRANGFKKARELEVPDGGKVIGITTESLMTNWGMREKGWWMIQSQRQFWSPLLVVHYGNLGGVDWRIVVFDRDGKKLLDRRPRWRFVPWVAQLEEHRVLDGTVEYLANEFWRLDKKRMNQSDKAEKNRLAVEETEILDQLDRLLPTYRHFDRKFRFDLFCSASMLCLSVNDYSRGMSYANASLELAPNDRRPHISWALNAIHFKENQVEAIQRCLKGVRLPPVAGDGKTASDSLELLKLELEREGGSDELVKLTGRELMEHTSWPVV